MKSEAAVYMAAVLEYLVAEVAIFSISCRQSAVGLSHLLLTFAADGDGWELHCCCKAKDHQATSHQGVRDMGSNEQNFKKYFPCKIWPNIFAFS